MTAYFRAKLLLTLCCGHDFFSARCFTLSITFYCATRHLPVPFNDVSSVDVFIASLIIYSAEDLDGQQQPSEERVPCAGSSTRLIMNAGFSADKICENEAIIMKLDI